MSNLENEVAKFRCWAKQRDPDEGYSGEWECDYPDWYELYAAVEELLAAERTLTDSEVDLILYVLARDNECEHVLELLEELPEIAAQVAQAAVLRGDFDARWQAAVLAGKIANEALVEPFLSDPEEYVRRRAGFALQDLKDRAERTD